MTERFAAAVGRKVISRASAEELGRLTHVVVDVGARRVSSVIVGKGRKARLVDWDRLSGFGPDAVVVDEEDALRPPADDVERAAAGGDLDLIGKLALSERGNAAGTIDDVSFDPATGELETVVVGADERPAAELLGAGSYAVVLRAAIEGPPGAAAPGGDPRPPPPPPPGEPVNPTEPSGE
jgi:sporulation protein YlmC with PRC-barrel domain